MSEQLPQSQELDLSTEEMTRRFAEAPVFAKKGMVKARVATEREEITTTLADGAVETVNTAEEGDVVVTNPGGEKYVLKPEKFAGRYEVTEEEGVFRAKGEVHAFENTTGEAVAVLAPWGEEQYGDPDCMLATVFDPENPDEIGTDRYIIARDEFLATYAPAVEVLGVQEPRTTPQNIGGIALGL